eukprot:g1961.t1
MSRFKKFTSFAWIGKRNSGEKAQKVFTLGKKQLLQQKIERSPTFQSSLCCLQFPFASNEKLRFDYTNHLNSLRFGLILADMDAFAGVCAAAHVRNIEGNAENSIPTLVTAAAQEIELKCSFDKLLHSDFELRGAVTHVGKTSLNIELELLTTSSSSNDEEEALVTATFIFVARSRDSHSLKGANVPPLCTDTIEQKELFEQGEQKRLSRREASAISLTRKPPNQDELNVIHNLLGKRDAEEEEEEDVLLVDHTFMDTVQICHPQLMNAHGKVFGGFLMMAAYELAWCNTYSRTGFVPSCFEVADVAFRAPVSVGSLLELESRIIYSDRHDDEGVNPRVVCIVEANVFDPVAQKRENTNTFEFLFELNQTTTSKRLPQIRPTSYEEAMLYLSGRRRVMDFDERNS